MLLSSTSEPTTSGAYLFVIRCSLTPVTVGFSAPGPCGNTHESRRKWSGASAAKMRGGCRCGMCSYGEWVGCVGGQKREVAECSPGLLSDLQSGDSLASASQTARCGLELCGAILAISAVQKPSAKSVKKSFTLRLPPCMPPCSKYGKKGKGHPPVISLRRCVWTAP